MGGGNYVHVIWNFIKLEVEWEVATRFILLGTLLSYNIYDQRQKVDELKFQSG